MQKLDKVYPEWVQKFRTKGTTVKKKGDAYYLYKRTSKRVPGKKYPQPVDRYLGKITPDGVIKSDMRKVSVSSIEVKEYGFSKAVWDLCPEDWKKPLGDDWEDVLRILIKKDSPNTFLGKEYVIKDEDEFRYQFAAQKSSLIRRIFKATGIEWEELTCSHLQDHIRAESPVGTGRDRTGGRLSCWGCLLCKAVDRVPSDSSGPKKRTEPAPRPCGDTAVPGYRICGGKDILSQGDGVVRTPYIISPYRDDIEKRGPIRINGQQADVFDRRGVVSLCLYGMDRRDPGLTGTASDH